ncbi:MAG: hypothetical protein EU981_02595 [Candidatus Liberibacter ctenarytainae]|uniref:Uncharacterized protein n=1 Tax=Candidatus Liberibacter ctenarytainae TaxID=2020335 RepID=A0A937DL79_9HYPH|nr:hypothetical protein [Candidatus Liberibacter ctenarytainae]
MNYLLLQIIDIFQPIVTLSISILAPLFFRKISDPLIRLLQLKEESKQLEIENMLRDSLHKAASNAIKFAISRLQSDSMTPETMDLAREYIHISNPDTISQLNISDQNLTNILEVQSSSLNQ